MKKNLAIVALGAAAAVLTLPLLGGTPVLAGLWNAGTSLAKSVQQKPQVQLRLSGEKQVVTQDEGQQKVTWQSVGNQVSVAPGDVLRYTLSGKNESDRPVKNLVLTQPVPKGTTLVLNSAMGGTQVTYSIDNGQSFVTKPTVQVKLADGKIETRPAPAEVYTHVRFVAGSAVVPGTEVAVAYQVKVR